MIWLAEHQISIYGRKQSEWDQLGSWFVNNGLYRENVLWLIQVESEGERLTKWDLCRIVKELKKFRCYKSALEMQLNTAIKLRWTTFSTMATMYSKLGDLEKAVGCLKKIESKMAGWDREPYHYLISLYGSVGKKEQVDRIWNAYKDSFGFNKGCELGCGGFKAVYLNKELLFFIMLQAFFLPSSGEIRKMLMEMDDADTSTGAIQEISKEFTTLMETLVHERDKYVCGDA